MSHPSLLARVRIVDLLISYKCTWSSLLLNRSVLVEIWIETLNFISVAFSVTADYVCTLALAARRVG